MARQVKESKQSCESKPQQAPPQSMLGAAIAAAKTEEAEPLHPLALAISEALGAKLKHYNGFRHRPPCETLGGALKLVAESRMGRRGGYPANRRLSRPSPSAMLPPLP